MRVRRKGLVLIVWGRREARKRCLERRSGLEDVYKRQVQGRSEVWVGEQSGKTQDRGEVVPATDCVVACALSLIHI